MIKLIEAIKTNKWKVVIGIVITTLVTYYDIPFTL